MTSLDTDATKQDCRNTKHLRLTVNMGVNLYHCTPGGITLTRHAGPVSPGSGKFRSGREAPPEPEHRHHYMYNPQIGSF